MDVAVVATGVFRPQASGTLATPVAAVAIAAVVGARGATAAWVGAARAAVAAWVGAAGVVPGSAQQTNTGYFGILKI